MREVDKVVVPPSFLDSILTVLHIRLNHPKQSQLRQVFDRYFFSPRIDCSLTKLYDSCHLCLSVKKFPKSLETFDPQLFPHHPPPHHEEGPPACSANTTKPWCLEDSEYPAYEISHAVEYNYAGVAALYKVNSRRVFQEFKMSLNLIFRMSWRTQKIAWTA